MFDGAVYFWALPISSSELRPPRNIYTDSEVFKETKVGFFLYIHDLVHARAILLLLSKSWKSIFETGYKADSPLSYCNDSNDGNIVSGDRRADENVFLGYGVRTVTHFNLAIRCEIFWWNMVEKVSGTNLTRPQIDTLSAGACFRHPEKQNQVWVDLAPSIYVKSPSATATRVNVDSTKSPWPWPTSYISAYVGHTELKVQVTVISPPPFTFTYVPWILG